MCLYRGIGIVLIVAICLSGRGILVTMEPRRDTGLLLLESLRSSRRSVEPYLDLMYFREVDGWNNINNYRALKGCRHLFSPTHAR